jgi:hypothetical protein
VGFVGEGAERGGRFRRDPLAEIAEQVSLETFSVPRSQLSAEQVRSLPTLMALELRKREREVERLVMLAKALWGG